MNPLYRSCRSKVGHASEQAAALALAGHREMFGDHAVVVYKCAFCPCWHIGHPPRAERRRMEVQRVWDLIDMANAPEQAKVPAQPSQIQSTRVKPAGPVIAAPLVRQCEPFLSILRRHTQKIVDAACHGTPRLMPRAVAAQKILVLTGTSLVYRLNAAQCVDVLEFFEAAQQGRQDWRQAERKLAHHSKSRTRQFRVAKREQAVRDLSRSEAA